MSVGDIVKKLGLAPVSSSSIAALLDRITSESKSPEPGLEREPEPEPEQRLEKPNPSASELASPAGVPKRHWSGSTEPPTKKTAVQKPLAARARKGVLPQEVSVKQLPVTRKPQAPGLQKQDKIPADGQSVINKEQPAAKVRKTRGRPKRVDLVRSYPLIKLRPAGTNESKPLVAVNKGVPAPAKTHGVSELSNASFPSTAPASSSEASPYPVSVASRFGAKGFRKLERAQAMSPGIKTIVAPKSESIAYNPESDVDMLWEAHWCQFEQSREPTIKFSGLVKPLADTFI